MQTSAARYALTYFTAPKWQLVTSMAYSLGADRVQNSAFSVVASLSVAVKSYSLCRCLGTAASSCSAITAFSRHITVFFTTNKRNEEVTNFCLLHGTF
jgi:hypothetical protein